MRRSSAAVSMVAILALVAVGCSSSTVIRTNVPGAKVYLDGEYAGRTPYTMTDTKVVASSTTVRIEAPGYETFVTSIKRNEQFSVGACIGGILVLVPFLWIMDYKPEHMYELRPAPRRAPAPPPPPAPAPAPPAPGR